MNADPSTTTLKNQLGLALLVFFFSQVVVGLVLNFMGSAYFDSQNWSRWDSAHYLSIAEKGYEFFPCAGKFGYPMDSKDMCGNTGWFPGYPLLLKFFGLFFKDLILVGGIISKVFYFLSLLFVLRIAELYKVSIRNFLFLSIAALSFGFIYYNAIFPVSGFVFFALASFYFFRKQYLGLASFFCFLASFFYATGFLLTVVFGLFILLKSRKNINAGMRELIPISVSGAMGFVAAFAVIYLSVGDWTAFLQVQAKYGNGTLHNPFAGMYAYVSKGFDTFSLENFRYYQTLVVIVMYSLVTFFFFSKHFFKDALYSWSWIFVTVFLFFPWIMGGDLSFYRAEALLLPFVFFLKDAKTHWLSLVLVALLLLGLVMSRLFFMGVLV